MFHNMDLALLRLLRTRGHHPLVELAVVRFSRLGDNAALWFTIAALGAVVHRRRRAVYLRALRTVALTLVLNYGAKIGIRRARPLIEDLPPLSPTLSTLSYPSAHASTSFAGARVLSDALPGPPLYAVAIALAVSRPYLGIHYPSDVVAGAAFGSVIGGHAP
ncbi:MAG: phosphatase PAP2 family protein [Thermoleophilaceae bacterium]|nr:phosphatase PAP2 family protein [Thermoleophilaceae bacterium]